MRRVLWSVLALATNLISTSVVAGSVDFHGNGPQTAIAAMARTDVQLVERLLITRRLCGHRFDGTRRPRTTTYVGRFFIILSSERHWFDLCWQDNTHNWAAPWLAATAWQETLCNSFRSSRLMHPTAIPEWLYNEGTGLDPRNLPTLRDGNIGGIHIFARCPTFTYCLQYIDADRDPHMRCRRKWRLFGRKKIKGSTTVDSWLPGGYGYEDHRPMPPDEEALIYREEGVYRGGGTQRPDADQDHQVTARNAAVSAWLAGSQPW